MVGIGCLTATVAFFSSTTFALSTTPASGFVSSDSRISFALNIPSADDSNDLYFTMSGPRGPSWIAVGMGSSTMDNSLIFMAYSDTTGKNITLSPRLSYDEVEPSYTSNVSLTVLPGSGITNGSMTVNAMCTNCRSWEGGSIDPTNTAAPFIFAIGQHGDLQSNSASANTKRHSQYGAFTMDLTKALGVAGVPVAVTADTSGTEQTQLTNDEDFSSPLHAVIMVFVFVGLMPFGIVVLRIFHSPKWHVVNQTISAIGALLGAALGIYAGTMYNRSKNFNSVHQVLGLLIIVAMVGQWVLGFLHHRTYKRTQSTTKLAPIHVWLGRSLILVGIINGFLGFPLALNSEYNWALLALILLFFIATGPFLFSRYRRDQGKKAMAAEIDAQGNYYAQPWAGQGFGASQGDINLAQMNTGSPPTQGQPVYGAPAERRQVV